jgi:hypothetical protein
MIFDALRDQKQYRYGRLALYDWTMTGARRFGILPGRDKVLRLFSRVTISFPITPHRFNTNTIHTCLRPDLRNEIYNSEP